MADLVVRDNVAVALARGRDLLVKAREQQDITLAKRVHDQADAIERLGRRQQLGEEWIGLGHAVKIEALALIGELLARLPKAVGTRSTARGRDSSGGIIHTARNIDAPSYKELGLDKATASVAQQLAALPFDTREAIAQRKTTIAKARREQRASEVQQAVRLPDAKYRVLYADPPWAYADKADAGAVQSGGAEKHYPSMTIEQLCDLDIPKIVEPDAVLFLWVTSPLLFESAAVIKAWGFTYKASFVWDKVKHNMGHYNSVRHEFLLICTRGRCTPDVVELFDSVQSIERTTHSTKPEEFRAIIDTLYPHGKRLELFARRTTDGWDTYGNESLPAVAS